MGVWIMDKEEEEENLKGPSGSVGLMNFDFEQMICSTFVDHCQSFLVHLGR
jgi:hypothetical protein